MSSSGVCQTKAKQIDDDVRVGCKEWSIDAYGVVSRNRVNVDKIVGL